MPPITQRCPFCRYPVSRAKGFYRITFGSPVRECPRCKYDFADKYCKELAIYEPKFYDKLPLSVNGIIFTATLLFFSIMGIPVNKRFSLFLFVVALIWWIIGLIRFPAKKAKLQEEYKKSVERLSNPEYAYELLALGVHVPEKYLKREKTHEKYRWHFSEEKDE